MTGKRKRYSADFKAKVALEALRGELTAAQLAAKHGVHQTMISEWKRQAVDGLALGVFRQDDGWITDAALLERLVAERMGRESETIQAEGWRWAGVGQEAQAAAWNLRCVWPNKVALSAEDETRRSELAARHDEIAEQHNGSGDDLPEDVASELDRIEAELEELEAPEEAWQPEDVAIGGVILTIAVDGSLRIDKGYVRAEARAGHAYPG